MFVPGILDIFIYINILVFVLALKRALLSDQTIEPTHIVGFNQFFDDVNGSDTRRYGIAVDHAFSAYVLGGVELSWRSLDVPIGGAPSDEHREEQTDRAYLYWVLSPKLALTSEYQLDTFDRDTPRGDVPNDLKTQTLAFKLGYYPSQRLFWKLGIDAVDQHAEFAQSTIGNGFRIIGKDEQFLLVDTEFGYRIPRRQGIASLLIKNLFDRKFDYQDNNFRLNEPEVPRYQPERQIFLKLSLSF